jgi:hypothetical protein
MIFEAMASMLLEMTSNPDKKSGEDKRRDTFYPCLKKAVSGNAAISQPDISVTHALCL